MAVDFALDPVTGDLPKQPYLLRNPSDVVLQRLRVRFRWFKGAWFLDTRKGIPYRELIFVKSPDMVLVSFVFRQVLLLTPGVAFVRSFDAYIDPETRTLYADFEAVLDDGSVLRNESSPFILG